MKHLKMRKKGKRREPPTYVSVAIEIWQFVEENEGCTFNQIQDHMWSTGFLFSTTYIGDHVRALVKAGVITEKRTAGRYLTYFVVKH